MHEHSVFLDAVLGDHKPDGMEGLDSGLATTASKAKISVARNF